MAKRGRPKKSEGDKAPQCPCGGASGDKVCKQAVICDQCGKCAAGCERGRDCTSAPPAKMAAEARSPAITRRGSGTHAALAEGGYAEVPEFTPPRVQRDRESVNHRDLSLPTATVKDLATAFGRRAFFLSSVTKTLRSLRESMRFRQQQYKEVLQHEMEGSNDEDEDEDGELESGTSSDEESSSSSSSSSTARVARPIAKCIATLRAVVGSSVKILAGGGGEAEELERLYIENEFSGWEKTLLGNARDVLEFTDRNSAAHRAVKAVFAESMENQAMIDHGLGRGAARAREDFASLKGSGKLQPRRQLPSGRSHVTDQAIDNAVRDIAASSSTSAWSIRRHVIKQDTVAGSAGGGVGGVVGGDDEEIFLPALHRLMSKSEMFDEHVRLHPAKKEHLGRTVFFDVARRLSRTQEKSMRALDYNITDLLLEPKARLKSVISDLAGGESDEAAVLLRDLDLVYSTVQHLYPKLIGTTADAPHNIAFAVGDATAELGGGSCSICSAVVRFFEERLTAAVGGGAGHAVR